MYLQPAQSQQLNHLNFCGTDVVTCGATFLVGTVSFDRICCDFGVSFEAIKLVAAVPAFCPAVFGELIAVSMTCFLVINFDKKSLRFGEQPSYSILIFSFVSTFRD